MFEGMDFSPLPRNFENFSNKGDDADAASDDDDDEEEEEDDDEEDDDDEGNDDDDEDGNEVDVAISSSFLNSPSLFKFDRFSVPVLTNATAEELKWRKRMIIYR